MSEAYNFIDSLHLNSIDDVKQVYDSLCEQEKQVCAEIDTSLAQHVHLESKIFSLQKMLPSLQLLHSDADQLLKTVAFTATLGQDISGKVKKLDLAKSRVSECLQRVEDILDLKFCTDGVQSALHNEDYEQAAAHVHRFLALDKNVLKRSAADSKEGSSLEEAFQQLQLAESKLKRIVMERFDEAVRDDDTASVERFFKIFPLLNQHQEGLKKFSRYLCSQISEAAQKNLSVAQKVGPADKRANVIYADTLTLLFEGIARVVEIHQPLIETYYGPGMLFVVMELLQKECDRQAVKVLEDFSNSRQVKSKVNNIQQSLKNPYKQIEKSDPRDLDLLLGEMTLLNARAELYIRFFRRRVSNDIEVATSGPENTKEKMELLNNLLKECELNRSMQVLLGQYLTMEEFFMRESVQKAITMDILEDNALTSSMLDDVFFILKKCIRRSLASSSVDGVCAMVNHACTLLDSLLRKSLWNRIERNTVFQQGLGAIDLSQAYSAFMQPSSQVQGLQQNNDKFAFLCTLNNSDLACQYIITLKKTIDDDSKKNLVNMTEQEAAKIESCLADLSNTTTGFRTLIDSGVAQLHNSAVKPRIKTWIDTFQSTRHVIEDEEFSQFEASDGLRPFVQSFIVNLDSLLQSIKISLCGTVFDNLVSLLVSDLTAQLDKTLTKCSFNRLGGLQFDKELRALITYLTTITSWTVRDKFARINQIATLLNLERVSELMDLWGANSGSLTWRLTPSEVRQVLALRKDFRPDEIKRLKL